ncbi:MAG TPA: hypothetical protein VEJ42_09830, partial [Streptosporangiaceae bacterium]|nr:hypothetical protein [Streptosporangiaceae bacterium]
MPRMTPEQEAGYALDFGVARSDLPEAARLAYDRLAEQRARGRLPGPDSAADAKTSQMVRLPVSPAGYSVAELGPVIAADVIALAAAVGLYLVIAVTSIASWPANRVL